MLNMRRAPASGPGLNWPLANIAYGLLPYVNKPFAIVALIEIGCSRISGLLWSEELLAIMDFRAPRATR
jgi:hypothetical protein